MITMFWKMMSLERVVIFAKQFGMVIVFEKKDGNKLEVINWMLIGDIHLLL